MSKLTADEELTLLERVRNGEPKAFDELARQYQGALLGYVRARVPASSLDPEDITQRVWVAVWKGLRQSPEDGGFDPTKGSFYSFVLGRYARFFVLRAREEGGKHRRESSIDELQERLGEAGELPDHSGTEPDSSLEAAERVRLRLQAFAEIFRIVFLCGGYPHQQLAFGFSKYLYGQYGDRAQRVHTRHGSTALEQLTDDFWKACQQVTEIPGGMARGQLRDSLKPLEERLSLAIENLMALDKASLVHFAGLAGMTAEQTCLEDYYSQRKGGYTAAIPDWCYKVERRVREVLGLGEMMPESQILGHLDPTSGEDPIREGACSRCKLRRVPPCG